MIGFMVVEWSWSKVYNFRDPVKELEDIMPNWRREDASRWRKWRFYLGGITFMIPRFIIGMILGVTLMILTKIFMTC